jgi:hypothetical protein
LVTPKRGGTGDQLITVEGQRFRVHFRLDEPGVTDFDWLDGPPDYGFTSAPIRPRRPEPSRNRGRIRSFLSMIDPETGYVADA